MELSSELKEKLKKIKVLLLDVDGVLTDGRIVYGNYGDELKFFDVQDGFGLVLLHQAGLKAVIVSAKKSKVNLRRAKEIRIAKVYQNVRDKLKVLQKVERKWGVDREEICFIGDDLMDLPLLSRVGFAAAVRNAVPDVKEKAHYVTERFGGRGAVREVADLILKAQGKWEQVTQNYFL